MAAGTIEVAPLAYMRGRTLNDAFIILDEAQNTNPEQMKMFSPGSASTPRSSSPATSPRSTCRAVPRAVCARSGDPDGVDDVHFSMLTSNDVVRHKLVGRIVDAYEKYDNQNGK